MLSERTIRTAKPKSHPYKLWDGGGLHVYVSTTGVKSLRMKFRIHGREQCLTLGRYPSTTLAEARDMVRLAQRKLSKGLDPRTDEMIEARVFTARVLGLPEIPQFLDAHETQTKVYFVQSESGHIKVGFSKNVEQRISDLQGAQPLPLKLLATMPGGAVHELYIHRLFAEYRRSGEWFEPGPRLLNFIEEHATHAYGPEGQASPPKGQGLQAFRS